MVAVVVAVDGDVIVDVVVGGDGDGDVVDDDVVDQRHSLVSIATIRSSSSTPRR